MTTSRYLVTGARLSSTGEVRAPFPQLVHRSGIGQHAVGTQGVLKIAALVDLRRRPAAAVRGRKWIWATVIALANSVGLVPIGYFLFGGRRPF